MESSLFKKYKSNCTVFFETGTHIGTAVQSAYALGFERIISIEVQERFYDYCMQRFQSLDAWEQIKLFLGRPEDNIEKLIQEWVNGRAMFWLDAHDEGGGVPTFDELALIKELFADKASTIIIDDIPLYFNNT